MQARADRPPAARRAARSPARAAPAPFRPADRARARRCLRRRPRPPDLGLAGVASERAAAAARATSSAASGRSVSRRQRERMVGSSRAGRVAHQQQQRVSPAALPGSSAAHWRLRVAARRPCRRCRRASRPRPRSSRRTTTVRRTSSTRITVRSLPVFSLTVRSSTSRSRCALRGDAARDRMVGSDGERCRRLHGRRRRIGMREHEARHPIGQRRLADAGAARRSARHAACGRCDRLRAAPARPRRGRSSAVVSRGCGTSASSSLASARSRGHVLERSAARSPDRAACSTDVPDLLGDRRAVAAGVDQHAAVRLALGQLADRRRAASRGTRAPRPRSGRPPRRRAARVARASPISGRRRRA